MPPVRYCCRALRLCGGSAKTRLVSCITQLKRRPNAAKAAKETIMGIAKHGDDNVVQGVSKQVTGKMKEVAGAVTGDLSQELGGKVEKNVGKLQEKVGHQEQKAGR